MNMEKGLLTGIARKAIEDDCVPGRGITSRISPVTQLQGLQTGLPECESRYAQTQQS